MRLIFYLWAATAAAATYQVRIEEPTGLYRRTGELARVPLSAVGGHAAGYTVVDAKGRELPWQVSGGALYFPVSLMPGELPQYRVACCKAAPDFESQILLRRLGTTRVELGNAHFRAVVDLKTAAITELYSLRAGPQRQLNLVETTPEGARALAGDVHETTPEAASFSPAPVAGVEGPNNGLTSLGGDGEFTKVELLEAGPLLGHLRLERAGESWDLTWQAGAPWLRWKASRGFALRALSAAPYLPFDRCLDGSEYSWPTGPGEEEPSPNAIGARPWTKLPGRHMVYYQRAENYGALGLVALDEELSWTGACSRRVQASKARGTAEIALTFPAWRGKETVLEARREYRVLVQPVLAQVTGPFEESPEVREPAARLPRARLEKDRRPTPFRPETLSLNGPWQLAWADKGTGPPREGWRTVQVPGTVHVQWLPKDQLYTRAAEWISSKEWWYRRHFDLPPSALPRRLLQFDATDYYADIYLNGQFVARHEGYIDPYELDVTAFVKPGANELRVRVWTPVDYYWKHRPYTIKGAYGAVDQKPDDITALGITRAVRLVAAPEARITDLAVDTRLRGAAAEVHLDLDAENLAPGLEWEATLTPFNFDSKETLQVRAPATARRLTLPVEKPRLWWTWDHGQPNLYTLDLRLVDKAGRALDGRTLQIGLREIERIGWDFHLNGRRLFIRGTNYYDHLFLSELTPARYEQDLGLMLGMNVNMIRLHCHFSNPEFYDLADRRGVLLWQDYLEAWYPHDTAFSRRAAELYAPHIRYVRNHASVALWATSDEEDFENYRDLTKHLAPVAAALDPQRRPVQRSTGRFGDSHIYHGWYDGSIWEYTHMKAAFVSELGATALPNYETLEPFLGRFWPIRDHADEWLWRRLQIPQAMKAWGEPGALSLREYIPQTQRYVARLFQLALERQRRQKREGASGILHFHAIDIWPSVTMAAIDFNRKPTLVYDTVRRSFAPIGVLFEYDRDTWPAGQPVECGLWAVNDSWEPIPAATVRWQALAAGQPRSSGSFAAPLGADDVRRLGAARFTPTEPGAWQLRAEFLDAQGRAVSENFYEFTVR